MPKRHRITNHGRKLLALLAAQGSTCFYCGRTVRKYRDKRNPLPSDARTIDHLIPRSKGGGSDLGNLCLCCYGCNQSKGARPWQEWAWPIDLMRPTRREGRSA